MNEKIKELAIQSGLQPFEDCGPGYVYKMEKFAELIVKECGNVASTAMNDDNELRHITDILNDHFGIEQ